MSEIIDDKSEHCIPFILSRLAIHHTRHKTTPNPPPFFLGLNGVQGVGKTVLVSTIRQTLQSPPHSLPTAVFSLDDLYLTHAAQRHLAESHPNNPLLQHRGQPSTHDIPLARAVFSSLKRNEPTAIPQYDKSQHNGQGDRVPESEWEIVNSDEDPNSKIKVVIFEGWCVGFRPLDPAVLKAKWEAAVRERGEKGSAYTGRLGHNTLQSVIDINNALYEYNSITDQLDALIHISALHPHYVYAWRLDQERSLRSLKGSSMTDAQVRAFVDGYYPAYELFTETLEKGIFLSPTQGKDGEEVGEEEEEDKRGRQLRIVVGEDRRVVRVERI